MRTLPAVLLTVAAFLATVPTASAAVSSIYEGAPARTLTVTSDDAGDSIVVSCPGGTVLVNGATPQPSGPLPCTGGTSAGTLKLIGNGGADTIAVTLGNLALGAVTMEGGEGDDNLTGVSLEADEVVTLLGGPGADTLDATSTDISRGGPGDDRISGLVATDATLNGEDGTDTYAFAFPAGAAPVNFTFTVTDTGLTITAPGTPSSQTVPWASIEVLDFVLNDGAQTFDASGFSGSARVQGMGGADTLIGTPGADVLNGGNDNDFIDGGGGADVFQGGSGLDLLHARDGVADTGDCGSDEDTLVADAVDAISNCERVDLPVIAPPPPPPADVTKPSLGLSRATLRKRKRKLSLPVSCPASETRCAGIVTLAGVGRRAGGTVRVGLGAITFRLAGGKTKKLTRRVSRRQLRALRRLRGVRLRVAVDVLDAAGNRATSVKRLSLRQ